METRPLREATADVTHRARAASPIAELWSEFITPEAERSIPEAQPAGEDRGDADLPPAGWAAARFWFSPYGITRPRDPDRGYPVFVQAVLGGGVLVEPRPHGFDQAARLLCLADQVDPWQAYTADYSGPGSERVLAEVLTPLGARLSQATASDLVSLGYEEVVAYGDEPFDRDDLGDERMDDTFLELLPPVCDGQNAAWRLAIVRAVNYLADDLRVGRAPLPTCFPRKSSCCCVLCCASSGAPYRHDAGPIPEHLPVLRKSG